MACDELVSAFRNRRESWNVVVTPCQPFSRRPILQGTIGGFGGKKCFAIGIDENHGVLELIECNFGELRSGLLVCRVINLTGGYFSPPLDPHFAKQTFAVPDQKRFGRRIGNAEARLPSHQRPTFNAPRPTFNSENQSLDVGRSIFS